MFESGSAACIASTRSGPCPRPADHAPVPLCTAHLGAVGDWIDAEAGHTDALPTPCRACGSRLGVRYPSGWLCAACEWRVGEVLDGELPPPRVDVVYYIRFDDRIKIGTTANPRQRLQRLWHDDVLAFERGDRLVERRRHTQFANLRQGTSEWFSPGPALDRHITELAAGIDDPWARHARWVADAVALRG
ncbi:GIY-YIG nuclease family protein [Labedella endophytica]|uniref:GIY-YIG nuclease family protein n=1 Tax=Labedella endophytica TaxID=1523160 RepID=A0A3S1CRT4_9MICO|nr:GIY-YIG nuclease family protein [Labedella endophytica]RUR00792.1 GIY-YIG nuclease family protein [Labedella endophytica]